MKCEYTGGFWVLGREEGGMGATFMESLAHTKLKILNENGK